MAPTPELCELGFGQLGESFFAVAGHWVYRPGSALRSPRRARPGLLSPIGASGGVRENGPSNPDCFGRIAGAAAFQHRQGPVFHPISLRTANRDDQTVALPPAPTWDGRLGACRSPGSIAPEGSVMRCHDENPLRFVQVICGMFYLSSERSFCAVFSRVLHGWID